MGFWIVIFFICCTCGALGAIAGSAKNASGTGFALGFFFGPLTVGRTAEFVNSARPLYVAIDGVDQFVLDIGQKGTCLVEPGRHTLSARIQRLVFCSDGQYRFSIEQGQHFQLLIDPVSGFMGDQIAFQECFFEGNFDY